MEHLNRKYRIGVRLLAGILCLFLTHSSSALAESPEDIVVFVNRGSAQKSLTVTELRQLFLKLKTSWSSGGTVVCINAPEGTALRKQFREKVLQMGASEEATYWETAKIRNQTFPPSEMLSTPKAVFRLKNALSYAYRKDVPDNVVKVILEIPK